jgi:hypothetical protein
MIIFQIANCYLSLIENIEIPQTDDLCLEGNKDSFRTRQSVQYLPEHKQLLDSFQKSMELLQLIIERYLEEQLHRGCGRKQASRSSSVSTNSMMSGNANTNVAAESDNGEPQVRNNLSSQFERETKVDSASPVGPKSPRPPVSANASAALKALASKVSIPALSSSQVEQLLMDSVLIRQLNQGAAEQQQEVRSSSTPRS